MSAGKSTIGELLAQKLNLPQHSLDEKRWDYYAEIGYDTTVAAAIANSDQGKPGLIRYWKPFEAHAVERMLADYSEGIIDFGAGHSVYEDEQLFARVQQALAPYDHIILLLPSPDLDESVAILNARFVQMLKDEGVEEVDTTLLAVNEQFVRHPSNHRLATMVIYTKDKTPEESCAEIIQKLGVKGIGL